MQRTPEPKRRPVLLVVGDIVDERLARLLASAPSRWMGGLRPRDFERFDIRIVHPSDDADSSPDVLASPEDALLVLLVGSRVAQAAWLKTMVTSWLRERSGEALCFGITEGVVVWDEAASDFHWQRTTALPNTLAGVFQSKPAWVDVHASRDRPSFELWDLLGPSVTDLKEPWSEFWQVLLSRPLFRLASPSELFSQEGARRDQQEVYLGAAAPEAVAPGTEFTARFVAYQRALETEVVAILRGLSPRSQAHLELQHCSWRSGAEVTVSLRGRHLRIAPEHQSFIWQGRFSLVAFDAEVATDAPECVTILKFDVRMAGFVIARLRLDLTIRLGEGQPTHRTPKGVRTPGRAFASYASGDRARVLDRVTELRKMASIDVFLDCLSLHPGEEWKARLADEIRKRDLFMLFWSTNARQSPWVEWEWRTALREKGLAAIDPHPLDPPDQAEPPAELSCLHFGDPYMLVRRDALERRP